MNRNFRFKSCSMFLLGVLIFSLVLPLLPIQQGKVYAAAPSTPTGLTALGLDGQILLEWTGVAGADSYEVYQGTATGVYDPTPVGTVSSSTNGYIATGLTNGTTYYFAVKAVNTDGSSSYSDEVFGTPDPMAMLYTVIYEGNGNTGGSVPIDLVAYPAGLPVPVADNTGNLTKTGYSFDGWNTMANGTGTAYAANDPLLMGPAHVTLYAQWQVVTAPTAPTGLNATAGDGQVTLSWTSSANTVTYNVYQGTATGTYNPVPIDTVSAPTTNYTATGLTNGTTYFFAVIAVNSGGSSGYSNEASATPIAPAYTVTYNGNGNTGGSVPTDGNSYSTSASVSVAGNTGSLTKTGHTFAGWNTLANGAGTAYAASSTLTMGSSNVTLYAQWTANNYTVTFNSNGGSAVTAQTVSYNNTASTPSAPTRTGYTFAGWYSDSGLSTSYNFATPVIGNVTLYAKWQAVTPPVYTPPTYTITYDGNGNTGGSVPTDSNTYQQGKSVSIADNTGKLTKTGYTFEGWNTQADGKGTTYVTGSTLTMGSANVTLYALWQAEAPLISTIAGTGTSGNSGDGGPAVEAKLNNPYGVAIDGSGNVYIADTSNNRIRKITADGTISTIAGTGSAGYSGDGGPADKARLNNPSGIALDGSGNVYIADRYNNRIRKITADGTISTIAGTGSAGYSGDGGPADQASINSPTGVAVDSSGNVYIADRYNNRIRKIALDGTITTVAGTGSSGYSGDGGPADKAQLYWPFGVALDNSGNLYIPDYSNHRVRKVTPDGNISTVAGTGTGGDSGDGGPANAAQLHSPSGIAIDSSGNLYISEYGGSRIRKITSDGTITTVAGTGSAGYSGDGGPADKAYVSRPLGVAVDSSGNVYIADTFNHRIRKVAMSTLSSAVVNEEAPTNPGTVTQSTENGQSTSTNGVITIQNNDSSDNFTAVLSGQSIQSMANKDQVLNVSTSTASISLPANVVNNGVSEQDASHSQVSVTIAEKPDTTINSVTDGQSKLASKIVDFSITVTNGDSSQELNNFGSTYVNRSFNLNENVNTQKAVGVVVNTDGTVAPVPTEFITMEGKQVAVLKRNGNSTYAVLENDVVLNDIAGHWGESTIQLLADKLIVSGFGDGSFRPDQQVTRAEFVALLTRALGLVPIQTENGGFTDVTSNDWYAGALAAAKEAGLVNGYADGSFRADQNMTRQDASVFLSNAINFLQLQGSHPQLDAEQALSPYKDAGQVSGYAQQAVELASSLGILKGQGDGTFRPKANTTRAETAAMIKNLMELAGFISY